LRKLIRTLDHVTKSKTDKKIKVGCKKINIKSQNDKRFIKKNVKTEKISDK